MFRPFFPPFFGHDIPVNLKYVFSHFFETIFFPTFFAGTIGVFSGKIVSCFFPPIFWSRNSCEYKKVFSHFFVTICFPTFFAGTIRVFLEKLFCAFFPPLYGLDIRVNIKKGVFALF